MAVFFSESKVEDMGPTPGLQYLKKLSQWKFWIFINKWCMYKTFAFDSFVGVIFINIMFCYWLITCRTKTLIVLVWHPIILGVLEYGTLFHVDCGFMYSCMPALDKQPSVRPIGVRETWMRLFDKIVLKFTGPEATTECQNEQLCTGF